MLTYDHPYYGRVLVIAWHATERAFLTVIDGERQWIYLPDSLPAHPSM